MIDSLKTAYRALLAVDNETPRVTKFVLKVTSGQVSPLVVDIGCGYGRTLRALQKAGIHAIGIDVNPVVVASNNQEGLRCFTPDEFTARTLLADVQIGRAHV